MKIYIKLWQKILMVMVAFTIAIVGFMVRLPSVFSGHDRALHTLFYFLAAAFLNILSAKRNLVIHACIFGGLYAFGVGIEYAQQFSNTYLHKKIHGNADPEDMHANLMGLIYFSAVWLCYVVIALAWKAIKAKDVPAKPSSVEQ